MRWKSFIGKTPIVLQVIKFRDSGNRIFTRSDYFHDYWLDEIHLRLPLKYLFCFAKVSIVMWFLGIFIYCWKASTILMVRCYPFKYCHMHKFTGWLTLEIGTTVQDKISTEAIVAGLGKVMIAYSGEALQNLWPSSSCSDMFGLLFTFYDLPDRMADSLFLRGVLTNSEKISSWIFSSK